MAEKAGFELDIKLDSQDQKRLNQIELSLQNINRYIGQAKKLGDQGAYLSLKKQQKDLRDEARNLNKQLKQQDLTMSDLVDRFRIGGVSVGDFKSGLANTQKALKLVSAGMLQGSKAAKILKLALASTGIGLLVVVLGSLVAWLSKTQEGMDFLSRATAIVNQVIQVLIDRASTFGEGLVQIFSGNFRAGFKSLGESIKGLGSEILNDAKAIDTLKKEQQALAQEEIGVNAILAERRNRIKDLSKTLEDQKATEKERAKAGKEANEITQQIIDIENSFYDRKIKNLQAIQKLNKNTREDDRELGELVKERQDRETANLELQTTVQNKLNSALGVGKKQHEELKKAIEGSLDSLTERLGKLNKELTAGNLQGDDLEAKLREILKLEEMIAAINDSVFATREQLTRGATPGTFDQLGPSDTFGIGEQGNIELQSFEARSSAILDAAAKQNERLKELDERRLEAFTEAQEKQRQLVEDTYGVLGEITGKYVDGEIESFNDYAKAVGSIFLDVAAKQVDSLFPAIVAKMTSLLGLPAGPIAATFIQGVIRGLLSSAKSKVSKLEEGGQLGFVAKGARHYHGGIPIGNGQEIEGGEPVLTRRAAQLFPHEINAINMASGGRRILEGGGIIGSPGPVLASSAFGGGSGIDSQMLAETIGKAVYTAAVSGLDTYARRAEREKEFIDRNVA